MYTFAVVTKVCNPSDGGNLAMAFPLYVQTETPSDQNGWRGEYGQLDPNLMFSMRIPVFSVGEILIMGDNDREVGYPGRKPSKWDIEIEEFATIQEAENRANEVMRG